jgi:parallel beta-helix repeat protein
LELGERTGLLRKTVSGILFVLLLVSVFTGAFNIQPVKASPGTIYIRADGSIDPPTAPITTVDNVTYALTGNVTSDADGIVVERSNIIVDGVGYTVEGTGASKGIDLSGRSNVTIKNTNVKGFSHGILVYYSSNNSISGNNITASYEDGILIDSSSYNSIMGNIIENNRDNGIMLSYSSNNSMFENKITNNVEGIYLPFSPNNSIVANNITENSDHGIFLDYSQNNTVSGNRIANNQEGILLFFSNYTLITANNMTNNSIGIRPLSSGFNYISKNDITNSDSAGIWLADSSSGNTIQGNSILGFPDNGYGVLFTFSSNNDVYGNEITNCELAIELEWSSNNSIYHNNLINNTNEVGSPDSTDIWDDGYPSGGNYWSDYEGRYPNAMEVDDSGIWNTPYVIDESNQDNYPLIHPYGSVQNLNTSLTYLTIQSAINAPETLHGHTIFVRNGTYYENVVVNKTLSLIGESAGSTIIDGNYTGITVDITKPFARIEKFTIQHGHRYGVHFGSDNAAVIDNILMNNTIAMGCWIMDTVWSDGDIIENNSLVGNGYGIFFYWTSYSTICSNNVSCTIPRNEGGIFIYGPYANVISKNSLRSGGIYFVTNPSSNNIITENNFYAGGITLPGALSMGPNVIYHNNFFSGKVQGAPQIQNQLDNGYPSGGNYWSDYAGLDLCSGPYQNETGSDGIGDTPYVINANNTDNYPLMKPYAGLYDIGITNVTTSKTVVGQSYNLTIIIKILNYGINTETFNLTAYANETAIQTVRTIVLTSRSSTTITFTWNTTGFAKGNYTISAYATPVTGETDIINNNCTDGSVLITKVGDLGSRVLNATSGKYQNVFGVFDGVVTGTDLNLFLLCYKGQAPTADMYLADLGSRVEVSPGPPPVYANVFFVCDGLVTGTDLSLFLQCYKGTGP